MSLLLSQIGAPPVADPVNTGHDFVFEDEGDDVDASWAGSLPEAVAVAVDVLAGFYEVDEEPEEHEQSWVGEVPAAAPVEALAGFYAVDDEEDDAPDALAAYLEPPAVADIATLAGALDVLEDDDDDAATVIANIIAQVVAVDALLAGFDGAELEDDDLWDGIDAIHSGVPDAPSGPVPVPDAPFAGFWMVNPHRYRRARRERDDEELALRAAEIVESESTKARDRTRARNLVSAIEAARTREEFERLRDRIEWAMRRAKFLQQRDDDDMAIVLTMLD